MNQRIKELAKQFAVDFMNKSGYDMREYAPFLEETEKFAELLIEECVNVLQDNGMWNSRVSDVLDQHFGVAE